MPRCEHKHSLFRLLLRFAWDTRPRNDAVRTLRREAWHLRGFPVRSDARARYQIHCGTVLSLKESSVSEGRLGSIDAQA